LSAADGHRPGNSWWGQARVSSNVSKLRLRRLLLLIVAVAIATPGPAFSR